MISQGQLTVINSSRACELNNENIEKLASLYGLSFGFCRALCLSKPNCGAIDWFRKTNWCNVYERACTNPLRKGGEASSYRVVREDLVKVNSQSSGM